MNTNPFQSKEDKLKSIWMGIVIAVPLIIVVLVLGNYSINFISGQKGERVLGLKDKELKVVGIEEVKKHLKDILPEEYELIEVSQENTDESCTTLFKIYPKTYSETERIYLSSARLIYCKDIQKAVFHSQLEESRYDSKRDAWARVSTDEKNEKTIGYYQQFYFGNHLVSVAEEWGSHYDGNLYIVRLKDSDELVVLSMPLSQRIRCEEFNENGTETWNEECVKLLTSKGINDAGNGWFRQGISENDYRGLLHILSKI